MTSFSFSILTFDIIVSSESSSIIAILWNYPFRPNVEKLRIEFHLWLALIRFLDNLVNNERGVFIFASAFLSSLHHCRVRAWSGMKRAYRWCIYTSVDRAPRRCFFFRENNRATGNNPCVRTHVWHTLIVLPPTGCYTAKDNILPDIVNVCITIDDLLVQRNLSIKELFIFDLSIFVFNRVKIIM